MNWKITSYLSIPLEIDKRHRAVLGNGNTSADEDVLFVDHSHFRCNHYHHQLGYCLEKLVYNPENFLLSSSSGRPIRITAPNFIFPQFIVCFTNPPPLLPSCRLCRELMVGPSSQTDASCTDTKSQIGNFRKVKSLRIIIYFTWRVPTNPIPTVYNRYTYIFLRYLLLLPLPSALLALAHIFESGGWMYSIYVQRYRDTWNTINRIEFLSAFSHIYSFHLRIEQRPTLCRMAEF